jgi:hypothetical protein
MNQTRKFDTFENDVEINNMVKILQAKGLEYMKNPDDLWQTHLHMNAIKSVNRMGKKVLAEF